MDFVQKNSKAKTEIGKRKERRWGGRGRAGSDRKNDRKMKMAKRLSPANRPVLLNRKNKKYN